MKTTVDLDADLLILAKQRAAALRRPLRELIEEGLRDWLAASSKAPKARRVKLRWPTVRGGLPPDIDVADRTAMHEALRRQP